jgi:hypothetical protein
VRDPVPWLMAGVVAAYGLFVLVFLPEYLASVVPLVRAQYLDLGLGNDGRWGVLLDSPLTPTAALFAPLAVVAAVVSREPLARLLALASFGAIVFALVQGKGWAYHVLPAEVFVITLAAVLACEAAGRVGTTWSAAARGLLSFALLASVLTAAYAGAALQRPLFGIKRAFPSSQAGQLLVRVEREAGNRPVLALTPGLYPHFPVLNYAGRPQALRFMNLWLLQSAYARCLPDGARYREPDAMPPAERLLLRAVVEDIGKFAPRMVVVDKYPGIPWCGKEFDFIEYFLRDPAFAAHWSHYEFVEEFDRYRIFVRR